jgi:hypothetical protein
MSPSKTVDRNLMVAVEVEDKEVAGHDAVPLAEPPPPVGQVRHAGAVEEELRGPYAGGAAAHLQHDLVRPHVDHLAKLAGQSDGVLVGAVAEGEAELEPVSTLRLGRRG